MTDPSVPPTVTRSLARWISARNVLVALLFVAAGCGALTVGTERATTTETLTPVPVPNVSDRPGQDDAALPPGVSADGGLDVDRLARAHADALAGTSYTETLARTVTVPEVPTTVKQSLQQVAVEGETALVERSGSRLVPRRTVYSDPAGTYLRTASRNRTTVTELNGSERVPTPDQTVSRFLQGLDVTVAPVEVRGSVLYRLVGTPDGVYTFDTRRDSVTVTNYTITALVAPSGFITELSVSYDRSRKGQPWRVRVSVVYTGLGSTSVSRPPWVPADRATPVP